MEEEARDWLKIAAAALAIIVTIGLSLIAVLTELQQTAARHDQEHSVFREDIRELREGCKTCRK
jgi:type II secretory pathway component PulL